MPQPTPVTEHTVRHALRTVRATAYRVTTEPGGVTLTLLMRASDAGRRTAAQRIAGLLDAHGLALAGSDPVDALLRGQEVTVTGTPGSTGSDSTP